MRYITKPWVKILEAMMVAAVTATAGFLMIYLITGKQRRTQYLFMEGLYFPLPFKHLRIINLKMSIICFALLRVLQKKTSRLLTNFSQKKFGTFIYEQILVKV